MSSRFERIDQADFPKLDKWKNSLWGHWYRRYIWYGWYINVQQWMFVTDEWKWQPRKILYASTKALYNSWKAPEDNRILKQSWKKSIDSTFFMLLFSLKCCFDL